MKDQSSISMVAKLQLVEPLHTALWAFRKVMYLFIIFLFLLQSIEIL